MSRDLTSNDFRIGNFVRFRDSKVAIPITEARLVNFGVGMEDIEPIPVSEGILSDLGFEKVIDNRDITGYVEYELCIGQDDIVVECEDGVFKFFLGYCYLKHIEYVHQVQNLYYAVCGEELYLK
jgi:hypothetical protein